LILPPEIWAAIIAFIAAIAGIFFTYYGVKRNLQAQYDIDLRSKRIDAYRSLWKELHLLRKHSAPETLSYGEVNTLLKELTSWYYEDGKGMYLTEKSRERFLDLLKELEDITKTKGARKDEAISSSDLGTFPDKETKTKGSGLRGAGSELRTLLLKDIGTREQLHLNYGNKRWRFKRTRSTIEKTTRSGAPIQ